MCFDIVDTDLRLTDWLRIVAYGAGLVEEEVWKMDRAALMKPMLENQLVTPETQVSCKDTTTQKK